MYRFEKSGGLRVKLADLVYSEAYSSDLTGVGVYYLRTMNCTTLAGAQLDVLPGTLPEVSVSIEREPEGEELRLGESRLRVR